MIFLDLPRDPILRKLACLDLSGDSINWRLLCLNLPGDLPVQGFQEVNVP